MVFPHNNEWERTFAEAVLKTLVYADIFDYPLTLSEIKKFLIASFPTISINYINKKNLLQIPLVEYKNGYFFLKGRKSNISIRLKRKKYSQSKKRIAVKAAKKIGLIPFVKMIGITGALAMENCQTNDDIDLIIISSPYTLWLTRLLIYSLLPFFGFKKRKFREKNPSNKLCFNLFLDESNLLIRHQNLFTAHEIAQVRPLINKRNTYEKFISLNDWIKDFLPNSPSFKIPKNNYLPLLTFLFFPFNLLAFIFQYLYMLPKKTKEKVTLTQAFFHPQDLSDYILRKYSQNLRHFELKKLNF